MHHRENNFESLVNLSLLESIRNKKPDTFYLDHFVLLMLSLIPKKEKIANVEIKELFSKKMLINIPLVSVNRIAKKAIEKGYFSNDRSQNQRDNLTYILINEKIEKQNKAFTESKKRIEDSQEKFYLGLKNFIKKKYEKDLSIEKCKELFYHYFLKNYKVIPDNPVPSSDNESKVIYNEDYVISDFIFQLYKNEDDLLKCLEEIIRGSWFSNYLFMWSGDAHKDNNLAGITVFLDTPLIISLLGFHGELSEKITSEMINLLNELKAKTCIFSHNTEETQSVLDGWSLQIKSGNLSTLRSGAVQEIRDKSYDSQDLKNLATGLKGFLTSKKITERETPKIPQDYRIDEKGFEEFISHEDSKYTGNKVHIDIKSATSIFALRRGQITLNITDKPHIFVSSTYKVVESVNNFFKEHYPETKRKNIPIFNMDSWLTNLCWISKPKKISLARDFLVANSYASLNGDSKFWESFNEKLEILKRQGKITEEGLQDIRYEKDFKHCVEEHFVSNKSIDEKDIHNTIEKSTKRKYKKYEEEIKKLKEKTSKKEKRLKQISDKIGHCCTIIMIIIIMILIFWIGYYFSKIISIIALVSSLFGVSFKYKSTQKFISNKIYNYFNKS